MMNRRLGILIFSLIATAATSVALGQITNKAILGGSNIADIATLQSQVASKADASAIPTAASTSPTMVADSAVVGSATAYARADHTHQSNVRKTTLTIAGGAGKATWTFSPAFAAGIEPICVATPIAATNATQSYIANISGDPTNTAVTVWVSQTQTQLLSILGVTVNVIASAPNAVKVKVICTPP